MHLILARVAGSGGLSWFGLLFLGLAIVIVYPDVVLDGLSRKTGKILGLKAMLVLEVCSS